MLLLDYDRLRELGRRPRLHPNGFIQFDLTPWGNFRLHVWPETPIPAQQTHHPVHDHCFDMESRVITGRLINLKYEFIIGGAHDFVLYHARRIGNNNTVLEPVYDDSVPGFLSIRSQKGYGAGETYKLDRGVLHNSEPVGLTATICERIKPDANYWPKVAVPFGLKPDNDFRRETIDPELLWAEIKKAIDASPIVYKGAK